MLIKKTTSPSRSAIQFGILFGIIMILEFIIAYLTNVNPKENPSVGIIMSLLNYMILPAILIVIGCNNFKRNYNNGIISLVQCLKIGISITVVGALLYAIFNVLFIQIFPEFVENTILKVRDIMTAQNPTMTEIQIEQAITMTKKFMSPYISIPSTMAIYAAIGLLYSLMIGTLMKNDKTNDY